MVLMTKVIRSAVLLSNTRRCIRSTAASIGQFRRISISNLNFAERRYTDKHEWVMVEGNIGTIGISDYAQEALGDVVFAQLPEPETVLKAHDECGALESVKAASEVYTPVGGKVIEKNTAVEDAPGLINTSCLDKGWLFKISLTNLEEVDKLMTESQYKDFLKNAEG